MNTGLQPLDFCMQGRWSGLVLGGLLTGYAHRSNASIQDVVYTSELVPFEDLFVVEDTLVLDPSVILGWIWFMDVDASGSVLITDIQSDLAHLFTPTGLHQATYSMDTCFPSDFGHSLWISRFANGDRIIMTTLGGTIVVFDRSGNCFGCQTEGYADPVFLYTGRFYVCIPGAEGPINVHHGCLFAGSGIETGDRLERSRI